MPDDDITVEARKALDGFWNDAQLKGRCWGKKLPENPYQGTNITIAIGDELVSVSAKDGKLIIHEFIGTSETPLGNKIKELLKRAGLF